MAFKKNYVSAVVVARNSEVERILYQRRYPEGRNEATSRADGKRQKEM